MKKNLILIRKAGERKRSEKILGDNRVYTIVACI